MAVAVIDAHEISTLELLKLNLPNKDIEIVLELFEKYYDDFRFGNELNCIVDELNKRVDDLFGYLKDTIISETQTEFKLTEKIKKIIENIENLYKYLSFKENDIIDDHSLQREDNETNYKYNSFGTEKENLLEKINKDEQCDIEYIKKIYECKRKRVRLYFSKMKKVGQILTEVPCSKLQNEIYELFKISMRNVDHKVYIEY